MTGDNRAAARAFIESIPTGKLDPGLMTADFTAWSTSSGEMPAERLQGGVALLATIFASPMRVDIKAITAEDERVVLEADSFGPLVNGDEYRNRYVFVLRLRDGKVCRFEEHNNPVVVKEKLAPLMQEAISRMKAAQQ